MANWLALYTKSRNEKKVHAALVSKGIEAFLPLQKTLKQWSDRKKWVEEPMIRSYVFVNTNESIYFDILNTPGAVRFIFFEGKPAVIPEWQINALKHIMASGEDVEVTDQHFEPGDKVMITHGPFRNITGELIQYKGNRKVVLRIDHIAHSLVLTIAPGNLKKI